MEDEIKYNVWTTIERVTITDDDEVLVDLKKELRIKIGVFATLEEALDKQHELAKDELHFVGKQITFIKILDFLRTPGSINLHQSHTYKIKNAINKYLVDLMVTQSAEDNKVNTNYLKKIVDGYFNDFKKSKAKIEDYTRIYNIVINEIDKFIKL